MAQVPNAYLWLAGDGDLRPALEAQVKTLGITDRVRFLGWRTDTSALYAAADYFICPSRHEPLGNVILEAMANGMPIISTDNNGAQQLLQQDKTGQIVPLDDVDAMATAMQNFIADPAAAKQLGTAAQKFYLENYSADIVCNQYIDFFKKILDQIPCAA